jgi:hypothetical protein
VEDSGSIHRSRLHRPDDGSIRFVRWMIGAKAIQHLQTWNDGIERYREIQISGLAPTTENHVQVLIYFARDFLADCICRFFFCGVSSCSSGRALQICSLTANNCAARSRKW